MPTHESTKSFEYRDMADGGSDEKREGRERHGRQRASQRESNLILITI